jgi:predicted acyl esterase
MIAGNPFGDTIMIWRNSLVAVLVLPCLAPLYLPAADTTKPTATDLMVATADGTELATTVSLPAGQGPFPVIVARTPYNKDHLKGDAARFNRQGYAFVAQDLRGRFKSKGHHAIIFGNDGWGKRRDGQDTLKWIAAQPWCNGKIGSMGGSALGITQNMTAPAAPAALKAQYVVVAFSDMYSQAAYQGGAFRTGLLENWLKGTGMTDVNLKTFVAHPKYDDFWADLNPESQAERVEAPGVSFGGWYDIFLQGTINSFTAIQNHGGKGARGHCKLVIAPIGHGTITELKYPASAGKLPDCANDVAWFDHILRGKANGVSREKAVHYYVMGDATDKAAPGNFWRSADHWPPATTVTPYYFHADASWLLPAHRRAMARSPTVTIRPGLSPRWAAPSWVRTSAPRTSARSSPVTMCCCSPPTFCLNHWK